jgi:hypothetical protein
LSAGEFSHMEQTLWYFLRCTTFDLVSHLYWFDEFVF